MPIPDSNVVKSVDWEQERTRSHAAQTPPSFEADSLPLVLAAGGLREHGSVEVRTAIARRAQQGYGNAAVGRMLLRNGPTATAPPAPAATAAGPTVVDIGGEKVEVANDAEKAEAEKIIKLIKDDFGVEISSLKSVKAIKKDYPSAPEDVKKGLKADTWKLKELKALCRALQHFAPILGKNRASSTRKDAKQEISSAGKVEHGIDEDSALGALDDTTLGEFFKSSSAFTMFAAGTDFDKDFPGDNAKQLEGTATHEIAHGVMEYALPDYVKGLDYWDDEDTPSGKDGAEAPITKYGATNASEDLSEAVMMYFVEPETLKNGKGKPNGTPGNPCPKRFALIDGFVKKWKPAAPAK